MVDKPMLRMLDFVIPDVTFHWCALGLTLLSQDTHGIETNHDKDVEKTCAKMLSIWLETHTKETRHKLLVAAELKEKLNGKCNNICRIKQNRLYTCYFHLRTFFILYYLKQ